jgi:hypothetical protein
MPNLISVLKQLEQERNRLASQLENLNNALGALGHNASSSRRQMSAAGRARIAAAQRDRWAKVKGRKVVPVAKGTGRTLSAAARRKIVAAQKARWAAWRREQKAA